MVSEESSTEDDAECARLELLPMTLEQHMHAQRLSRADVCKMTGVKRCELDKFLRGKLTHGNGLQAFADKLRKHPSFWHFEVSEIPAPRPAPAKSVPFRLEAASEEEEEPQGGDPYLLSGNRATIQWPLDDGSVASFTGTIRYWGGLNYSTELYNYSARKCGLR